MKQTRRTLAALVATALTAALLTGCTENIDMSNRYTFTEETISGYLEKHEDYSEYYRLIGEINVSSRSESTILQLLSARGNYTVFAPTDAAVHEYLATLFDKGIISEPTWDGFPDEETLDSIRKVIVYNSIIDGGDDIEAYNTGTFPKDTEEFLIANLNDRKLTINYGHDPDSIYINGTKDDQGNVLDGSLIDLKNRDIFAINGYIHQVHTVVAPSNESLGELLMSFIDSGEEGFIVISRLIQACGLIDSLRRTRDEDYEYLYQTDMLADLPVEPQKGSVGYLPEHRKFGFTIFAEPDDFWRATLAKEPIDITPEDVKDWVISQGFYPDATDDGDYSSEDNVLNQFVTYHLLRMRLPSDKLVIHYNEKGYYYSTSTSYTVAVNETYSSMGKRRMFTLYQVGNVEGIFINRFPNLDNGRQGTYQELSCDDDKCGFLINTAEAQNVVNGYIYPISAAGSSGPAALAYNEATRDEFHKRRWRYDIASIFPEFMNNDIRAQRVNTARTMSVGFPVNSDYPYLDDATLEDGTTFYYYLGLGQGWANYQGDAVYVPGRFEFTMLMPPVAEEGTYELRFLVSNTSSYRGMCQVYFGSDTNYLYAMGLPLDLRINGSSDLVGWEDDSGDEDYDAEVDKRMRNNDFMKGPEHYHNGTGSAVTARHTSNLTRRILMREYLYPDRNYYLKFKSVLDSESLDLKFDWIELCPKEVYDNPNTPEDIW